MCGILLLIYSSGNFSPSSVTSFFSFSSHVLILMPVLFLFTGLQNKSDFIDQK